jgi:transposase-like protein
MDGTPIRKLANELEMSKSKLSVILGEEMNNLIENSYLSKEYTIKKVYEGILILDGKYVKVKGFDKKIPFIYAVDYYTHDIVCGVLFNSESTESFKKLFRILKEIDYPLRYIVCDNVLRSLIPALYYHYPEGVKVQLCLNHYVENIRNLLRVRTEDTNKAFFKDVYDFLYLKKKVNTYHEYRNLLFKYEKDDICKNILLDMYGDLDFLFTYELDKRIPNNTNLIELFNSHLNARLTITKGFNSFLTAERFLNAWMIRRRTLPFTDCSAKFSYLNNKTSLYFTAPNFDYSYLVKQS